MFEFTRNFYSPEKEGSESSFTPDQVIILEQTVSTSSKYPSETPQGGIITDSTVAPDKLLIEFNDTEYIVKKATTLDSSEMQYYGEMVDNRPAFNTYPFLVAIRNSAWRLFTNYEGTYTISAKIPEEKSPKVFVFPKGRTIVSELSRINKAFGTISKKKTIIGQLSDIADAAEAGKIGGGSGGALMVHANEKDTPVLDKTWQEIYDALKTTSVYIINENEEEMSVSTIDRIIGAQYSDGLYRVYTDNNKEYTTNSSNGYPAQ